MSNEHLAGPEKPANDGTDLLKKFKQCQDKIDPTISDIEFAKKMYKEMQPNPGK